MENLIQANALFRNSLEGRFALDINQSILLGLVKHAPKPIRSSFVIVKVIDGGGVGLDNGSRMREKGMGPAAGGAASKA